MQKPTEFSATESDLKSTRNLIAIVVAIGLIVLLYFGIIGAPDTLFWVAAVAIGALFYFQSGNFLSNPKAGQAGSLQGTFYLFVIAWISGLVVGFWYWGVITTATIVALLLSLGATYLLQKFVSGAKTLTSLGPQPGYSPVQQQPSQIPAQTQVQPPEKKPQYCPNCGASLAGLADSVKFCPNCGSRIA
jgi:hypothetical protein